MKIVEGTKGMLQIAGGRRRRLAEAAEPLEIYPTNNTSNTPLPSPTKNRILRKANEQGSKTEGEDRAIPLSDPLPPPHTGKAVYAGSENGLGIGEGVP